MQRGDVSRNLLSQRRVAYVSLVLPVHSNVLGIRARRISALRLREGVEAHCETRASLSSGRASRLRPGPLTALRMLSGAFSNTEGRNSLECGM